VSDNIIQLLPDNIANQIAAGEVIQRPASAVKELLENAIDAGADNIQLLIKDGGKTLIQVIDNGKGMSAKDARLCFDRHATSKIKKTEDLFLIKTMGFRGEALASIASIAQIELKTKREEDELGTKIIIEGSEVKSEESCVCPVGTSISVKNLFFNVPARRKFLKSNPLEAGHIRTEFQRIVIAHAEIFFSLFNDDIELYHLKKGNLKQRIIGLMRKNYDKRLVPVEENTNYLEITGFIGKPQYAKKSRGEQFFFVNNRFIKSSVLHTTVMDAYDNLLQSDHLPFYVIFIEMDPKRIDVNVHPTKQEIKFEDDQIVTTFLGGAVRKSLSAYNITPSIDFEQEVNLGFSFGNKPEVAQVPPSISFTKIESKANTGNHGGGGFSSGPSNEFKKNTPQKNWDELYKTRALNVENKEGEAEEEQYTVVASSLNNQDDDIGHNTKNLATKNEYEPFQLHNRYIVYHIKSGIIMMDQQAAHERILYEKNLKYLENNTGTTQKLMFSETLELSVSDKELLRDILPQISKLGYEIEEQASGEFVVKGVPAELTLGGNTERTFDDLLVQYKENVELKLDKIQGLAEAMARHAALKSGKRLSRQEMQGLIDQLFACDKPYIAPNGRKTFITQSLNDLDKQFKKK